LDKRTRRADPAENAVNLAGGSGVTNTLDKMVNSGFFENISNVETKYEQAKNQLLSKYLYNNSK
jgi:hypothetical protein